MPSQLPPSSGHFFQDPFESREANLSTEALASNNSTSSDSDQLSSYDQALSYDGDLLPDFSPHYIPPLNPLPSHHSSGRCIMDAFTSSTSSGRRFAIAPNDYTLGSALVHTLPASILSPPRLMPGEEVDNYGRYQHDEYNAFNATRRPRGPPYTDMNEASESDPLQRRTHRPGDASSTDPPPPYHAANMRRANRIWRDEARIQQRRQHYVYVPGTGEIYQTPRHREGETSVIKSVGLSFVSCFAGMGKTAKEMRRRNRVKRAKGKIAWLERHDFMSAQDRLLTQEMRRDGEFRARFGGPWCVSGCTFRWG